MSKKTKDMDPEGYLSARQRGVNKPMIGRISLAIPTLVVLTLITSSSYQLVRAQNTSSSHKSSSAPKHLSQNTDGSQTARSFNGFDLVDKTGNIRKPTDVRDLYQFLGSYAPTGTNGEAQMHVTYATPGAAQYYRENGKFADGTVLVKETFTTDHAQMTTGDARWAKDTVVWFVMIKDAKNRFPNNPLWGNGWGWALFKADAPDKQVATNFKKDCLGCHIPAQSTDWLYIQGYPVLKAK